MSDIHCLLEIILQIVFVRRNRLVNNFIKNKLLQDKGAKKNYYDLVCTEYGSIIDYTNYKNKELKLSKQIEKELSKKINLFILQ